MFRLVLCVKMAGNLRPSELGGLLLGSVSDCLLLIYLFGVLFTQVVHYVVIVSPE